MFFSGKNIMGILSKTVSLTRYRVEGKIEDNIIETVREGLQKRAVSNIENEASEFVSGWASLDNPFRPRFEGSSFLIGNFFVFSLRIDKKTIPSGVIKKYVAIEIEKKLKDTGRDFLSKNEKTGIKEYVFNTLLLRIPSTPNIYDILWNYEDGYLWFFTTQKAANEELENLFHRSFHLQLIRLFPYTTADLLSGLSNFQRDLLHRQTPSIFMI